MRSEELTATARIRNAAIQLWGQGGFGIGLRTIAEAAGVSAGLVIHHFGSKARLRKACDDYVLDVIRTEKTASVQSADPAMWLAQVSEIESYAPLIAYIVRSLQSGGELGATLLRRMIENAEQYMEEGVRAGTLKPSRDPGARARFLAVNNAGGLLLYMNTHENPGDTRAVLRDYARDMMLPALEVYTEGLMADSSMLDAIIAREQAAAGRGGESPG